MRTYFLAGVITLTLAGCSSAPTGPVQNFGDTTISPGENDIEIMRELTLPTTLQTLPPPTPGGTNRAEL